MRPIKLTLLALPAPPVLTAEPPLSAPTASLTAPTRPIANDVTQYCMYASQPYFVGSVLNGRACGYQSDGWPQPPDSSTGAVWRLPFDGEDAPRVGST